MRARSGSIWMAILAAWIGGWSLVMWLWSDDELQPALLTGAAGVFGLVALYWAIASAEQPSKPRRLAQSSLPTVLVVVGFAMAVNGLVFGLFLILIGVEVAALGVGLLVAQHIAGRRERA